MPQDEKDQGQTEEDNLDDSQEARVAPWSALFTFTTKRHTGVLCLALVFSVISGANVPAKAYLIGKAFNSFTTFGAGQISGAELKKEVAKYCTYLAVVGLLNWLTSAAFFMFWLAFAEMQAKCARDRVFEGLLEKDMTWYDLRKNGISASIPRFQMQIRELQTALSAPMGDLAQYTFVFFSCLGLAFYYAWDLTLVTIAGVPVIFVGVSQFSRLVHAAIGDQQEAMTEASKHTTTAFSSIDIVKYFNGQKCEVDKYKNAIGVAAKHYGRQAHWNAFQQGFVTLCTRAMFVQGFWYGSTLIGGNKKRPGQVLTTFWAALQAVGALQSILPQMIVLEKGRAAGAKLRRVAEQVHKRQAKKVVIEIQRADASSGGINFENVSFAYPSRPDQKVLRDVTLAFRAAETTFVIGKSGSGKSTLGQLLMRFYNPEAGKITLDRTSISDLSTTFLRSNITLVEQQSILFNDTIYWNLAFGSRNGREVSEKEVRDAIAFALLQQAVQGMPNSLDTMVGAQGSSMSGGQKQRMALARTRIRDTPILILDESTSALDHTTRELVMRAIRIWREGKTTLIITHDIAAIEPQDFVYIMEDGAVVEQGYRDEIETVQDSPFQGFITAGKLPSTQASPRSSPTKSDLFTRRSSSVKLQDSIPPHLNMKDTPSQRTSYASPNISPRPKSAIWSPYALTMQASPASPFQRPLSVSMTPQSNPRWSLYMPDDEARPPKPPPKEMQSGHPKQHSNMQQELIGKRNGRTDEQATPSRVRDSPATSLPRDRSVSPLSLDSDIGQQARVKPTAEEDGSSTSEIWPARKILTTVWPSLGWSTRLVLLLGFMAALAHAVAIPIFSWLFSRLISTFFNTAERQKDAMTYSLGILAIAFGDGFGIYFMHMLLEYCGQCWADHIRLRALARILAQSKEFFARKENSVSRLAESLDRNAEEMRYLVSRFAGLIFVAIVMMGTSIVWALVDAWQVTLIGLVCAPYVYAVSKAYAAISSKWESISNDAAEAAAAIFTETFTSIKTVRSLTLEGHFRRKHLAATQQCLKVGLQRSFYTGFFFGLTESSIQFVTALIFYSGALLASRGHITVPSIIGAFSQLLFSIANVSGILEFIPQMSSSLDTATRLLRLANLSTSSSHECVGHAYISAIGDIEFRSCNFSYPSHPRDLVLSNLNLTIKRNRTIALVGASGSGKSTIASLILGIYPPNPPPVFDLRAPPPLCISGRSITRLDIPTLRSLIGVVPQTPILFPASLYENIVYGLPEGSPYRRRENVRKAAQQAGVDEWISSLPESYDTVIGEGGSGLSGGQAQRVAIARALVREVKCLVLDECTSALDVESSALVRDTIVTVTREKRERDEGMTVLIITHSVEMMRIADDIAMLEKGSVVEEGDFEGLMKRKGAFWSLVRGVEAERGHVEPAEKTGKGKEVLKRSESHEAEDRTVGYGEAF
ncbi:MAG: hypothetical protein Q9157_007478 [Trypethelium eluteriae]